MKIVEETHAETGGKIYKNPNYPGFSIAIFPPGSLRDEVADTEVDAWLAQAKRVTVEGTEKLWTKACSSEKEAADCIAHTLKRMALSHARNARLGLAVYQRICRAEK